MVLLPVLLVLLRGLPLKLEVGVRLNIERRPGLVGEEDILLFVVGRLVFVAVADCLVVAGMGVVDVVVVVVAVVVVVEGAVEGVSCCVVLVC